MNSKPEEIDVLDRKIQQLEIEKVAFKREKDKSKVEQINKQLADLEEERNQYMAKWEGEKEIIAKVQQIKQEIESYKFEAESAERNGDLGKVAEIRYGALPAAEKVLLETIKELKDYEQEGKRLVREEITSEDIA